MLEAEYEIVFAWWTHNDSNLGAADLESEYSIMHSMT